MAHTILVQERQPLVSMRVCDLKRLLVHAHLPESPDTQNCYKAAAISSDTSSLKIPLVARIVFQNLAMKAAALRCGREVWLVTEGNIPLRINRQ
jgi:hypothetical protein